MVALDESAEFSADVDRGLTDRDWGAGLLKKPLPFPQRRQPGAYVSVDDVLNVDAQLTAIRELLATHEEARTARADKISSLEDQGKRDGGLNVVDISTLSAEIHASIYQDAAHCIATTAMLAPLFEAICFRAFRDLEQHVQEYQWSMPAHQRWMVAVSTKTWDCHFWLDSMGKWQKDIAKGVCQVVEATGLDHQLPNDFRSLMTALFTYRNKMLHNGLEWPSDELSKFAVPLRDWPTGWFNSATVRIEDRDMPHIFYSTDVFLQRCLSMIDALLEGLGSYVRTRSASGPASERRT